MAQTNEKETKQEITMGQWLQVYRNCEDIKDNVFISNDESELDVTPPSRYDAELPQFEDIPCHTKETISSIYDYFVGILDDDYSIQVINDKVLNGSSGMETLQCDYCRVSTELWMYHCTECNKDMCELCFKERSEEIALANGAKNWSRRKDALLACFAHEDKIGEHEVDSRDLPGIQCDLCGDKAGVKRGTWSCNRRYDKDLCLGCLNSVEHKDIVEELLETCKKGTWKFVDFTRKKDYGIGSLIDWVPVLRDSTTGAGVFYNMNPESKYYHQVVLSAVDNHGREGYFSYPGTLEEVLDKIRAKIPDFEKVKEEKGQSWDTHYNCPINLLLVEAGHEIHYG